MPDHESMSRSADPDPHGLVQLRRDLARVARAAMGSGGLSPTARGMLADVAAGQPVYDVEGEAVAVLRLLVGSGLLYEDGDGEWWTEQCCNDDGIAFTGPQREYLGDLYRQARGVPR